MIKFKRISLKAKVIPFYDLYMGRPNNWLGLEGSKWQNPFRMKNEGDRERVLAEYEQYVEDSPDLIKALPELVDKVLACYCPSHKKCHIDVLNELYNKYYTYDKQK